ncbi:uncharacterized protein LOC110900200 [Helianthus annuus]|uniref:uncharacterized protein LOC110900200 n=1 Tax=Helianthus annuus TaxID=4232 RepID=UPI001652CFB7|nr:uncharacterized protein LOC110900200 [Helianthus annuus]
MQSLENVLMNDDFIYETREEPGTEIVTEIFFLHQDSRVMWRAFPHVMMIDATYKTNIYNMPFIQIVGMTPTNKSFIIAHAVVSKERGDNFVWVLERVKAMLDECMEPRVILTDRDLALMGACAKVFPDASRLLCRWHIQQNVMKYCKGAFTDDDWKKFMSFWGTLIESPSIPIYDYHLRNMRKRLVECKRSRVFKYVYDNWLKDYKEMFVFAWTDKRRNFGNCTTNRVESQHANLKRYVEDRSSLDRIVGCVRDIVETQFGEIRKTFRESIEKTMKHHKHPMFQHLLGKVSHKALDLLHGEAIRRLDVLERFNSSRGCQMWHSCGLPCACRIEKYMREERPIQLEDIDVFWRKLNFQSCKLIDDSLDVVEELDVVRQQLQSHPPAQQKSLLSKIKAVLTPTKSTKKPPVVQQNTRGRPTTKQVQERLDEASRIDEELRRSSFGDANTCFEGSRQSKYDKPRHSSYVPSQASQQSVIRSQKPKATLSRSKSSKKKETRDDHGFPLIIGDEYVGIIERFKSDIPPVFHPYVSCIRDVMPDGHLWVSVCGCGLSVGALVSVLLFIMEDDLIPGDDIHIEPVQQGPRRRQRPPVDTLQGHPYLEFPDGTDAARHCQKLRRMHVGSHASIDWDAMEEIAETPRVRRFIPIDSPWHRLFDLAHTPTYRELLVEFLSSFTFHPPGEPVPLPYPGAPHPPEVSFRLAGVMRSMTLAQFAVHCGLYMQEEIETEIYTAGLVVVEKPTLVGFWQVIAGADHWEHEKSKGRVSFVRDPLYRYLHHLLATSI